MTDLQPENAYPTELVAEIAEAVGVADPVKISALARGLHEMPDLAAFARTYNAAASPTKRIKALNPVLHACSNLLKSLNLDPEDPISNNITNKDVITLTLIWPLARMIDPKRPEWAIRYGKADAKLQECVRAVQILRRAATDATEQADADKQAGRGGRRHEAEWALHEITYDLLTLYREVTGRNIGTSVDPLSGEPGGPAIRFLELCLPPLGWNLSRQAIRHSIRRTREELA